MLAGSAAAILRDPPEWARRRSVASFVADELYFDAGARAGLRMRLDPYQIGILDAFERSRSTAILAGAQAGKTTCLLAVAGHSIAEAPTSVLVVQPTERPSAQDFSKQRIDPMIRASPVLAQRVIGRRAERGSNSVSTKMFPGGFLSISGANSSANLASKPIEVLLADEIDKWPGSISSPGGKEKQMVEGDPLMLARRRQHGFVATAREMVCSTPTTVDGRIWLAWRAGDQCVWVVPCPLCGHEAPMTWGDHELQPGHGPAAHVVAVHKAGARAEGACMTCGACAEPWSRLERIRTARRGRWVPTAKGRRDVRSFYAWRAMSSFGEGLDRAWEERQEANDRAAAGEPEALREWRQGVLGVPSRNDAEDYPEITRFRRAFMRRVLAAREAEAVGTWRPAALVHTAAVDVQIDCLHLLVCGWESSGRGWLLERATVEGDPSDVDDDVWHTARAWIDARAARAINIDSGYLPSVVDEIVGRWGAGVAQVKGRDGGRFLAMPTMPDALTGTVDGFRRARGPAHVRAHPLWMVGTWDGKRGLMARLAKPATDPRAILPCGWMREDDVAELLSEHEVRVANARTGRVQVKWRPVQAANHLLDLTLYAWHAWRRLRLKDRAA